MVNSLKIEFILFWVSDNNFRSTNNLLLVDPSSNSNGIFNYSSNNDNVDISGNLVIFRKLGKCEITATQVETSNYTSKSTTINFYVKLVDKIELVIQKKYYFCNCKLAKNVRKYIRIIH